VRGAAAENSSTKKSGNSRSTDSEESPAAQQLPQSLTPLRR
jgi:hypothetical protein